MSYAPIDTEPIPLQDFSDNESVTSEVFGELHNHKTDDDDDFSSDPHFQNALNRFQGSKALSKKTLYIIGLFVVVVWASALVYYSNGNAHKIAHTIWHGADTNLVLLSNRNVSLNTYLLLHSNVSMEAYRKGHYWPREIGIRWLEPAQFPTSGASGYYLTFENNRFVVHQVNTKFEEVLLDDLQFEYANNFVYVENIVLNPAHPVDDKSTWHILKSDLVQQWRHLEFSLYWMWCPVSGEVFPLQPPTENGDKTDELQKLHFVNFSPSGDLVLFGHNHDLFLYDIGTYKTTVITSTGTPAIFNGKPDWVYEEEVYAHDHFAWWSPDLLTLAFAVINDTQVEDYKMEYYLKDDIAMSYLDKPPPKVDGVNQYPVQTSIKYPKPGTNNPIVSLKLYDIQRATIKSIPLTDGKIGGDFILYDVSWVSLDHLLIKVADRTSTIEERKVYTVSQDKIDLVLSTNTSEYNGWVEKSISIAVVNNTHYLDKIVDQGIVKVALFELNLAKPKILAPVHYSLPLAFNAAENVFYCVVGTNLTSNIALISFDGKVTLLTSGTNSYNPHFSKDAQFVSLVYQGPHTPWQKLLNMAEWHELADLLEAVHPIIDNNLKETLETTNLPSRIYSRVRVGHGDDSVELNMKEIFPPNFDPSRKYPLLVYAYGGPGSTAVDLTFLIDFQDIISSQLGAVVLVIDPRGTGSDDWKLKSYATRHLGYWEPRDITSVAADYIKTNKYVDDKNTAIWGWSYGGFTALKVLEFDHGNVFKYGMAVAPVTNWLFYDSIYTERYMKNLETERYKSARISDFASFKEVNRFLMMHGSADDNVHLQNLMWLMDNFDIANVENYDVHIFPDSEHSIYFHNANTIVYDKLLTWLGRAFSGVYV